MEQAPFTEGTVDRERGFGQEAAQLLGLEELRPVVGAGRQPAQHIFRAHFGERESLQRAVEGGHDHQPALLLKS